MSALRSDASKRVARQVSRSFGRATLPLRMQPDFLVVGAQRCGTTSLFRALAAHPQVVPPLFNKGIHYFDVAYDKGFDWYRSHFPMQRLAEARVGARALTGEASPYYMFHPSGAERIAAQLDRVKVIAMVRDPVERAFSAHRQETHRGFEDLPFADALDREPHRLAGEVEHLRADPGYVSFHHQHHAYVARGEYAPQLRRLIDALGRERVHVIESEVFFHDPGPVWTRLLEFLGLDEWRPEVFEQHNARTSSPMDSQLRDRLTEHFAPHDADLAGLLGHAPVWSA